MFGGRRIGQGGTAKINISLGKKNTAPTTPSSKQGASNHNNSSSNSTSNTPNDSTVTSSDTGCLLDATQNTTKKIELNLGLLRERKTTLGTTSIFASVDVSKRRRRRYQRDSDEEDEYDSISEEKDKVIALTGFADNEALQ
jgi:hypothetical protein